MKKADINTIAEACAVSKTTVSKVFTQKEGVSESMRKRILDTARQLNYTPRQVMAQDTIAIVVSKSAFSEGSSFRAMLLASVMNRLTDSGYLLKIVTQEELKYLLHSYTKLAILISNKQEADVTCEKLRSMHIPIVTVNTACEGSYAVCTDHAKCVEQAVDILVGNGHKKISLMLDSEPSWGGQERIRGYLNAMKRHHLEPLPWRSCYETATVVECLNQIRNDGADALIIEGESIVHEAVYMLELLRINVPDDISVISSEICGHSRWFMPPHTTITQHLDDMAQAVVDTAEGILSGNLTKPQVIMLPGTIIKRNSIKKIK